VPSRDAVGGRTGEPPISTDEFRTLDRCLDDAVASSGAGRQISADARATTLRQRLVDYIADHRPLNAIARQSFTAIRTGNIGAAGATGDLLTHTLKKLDQLTDRIEDPQR
jgi:hypothetical protein